MRVCYESQQHHSPGQRCRVPHPLPVEYLITAPAFLAFMLGLRFLTDHLAGDEYFVVSKHGDNLQRAIEQFELFDQFQCNEDSMRACARIALDQLTTLTQSF